MAMMKQQQAQTVSSGQGTLKLLNFVEQIGNFNGTNNNIEWWQAFVDRFFAESGSFVHIVCSSSTERSKQFEIVYAALPRYFYTLFNTDVASLQITLDGATEKVSGAELKVTCERAKFIYTYKNSCQVVYQGKLTAFWSGSDKLEWLLFDGLGHEQFIPLNALKQMFVQPSPNQLNPNQSPRMKKKAGPPQQRGVEPPEAYLPINKLLSASTTDYGLPHGLQAYLEVRLFSTSSSWTLTLTSLDLRANEPHDKLDGTLPREPSYEAKRSSGVMEQQHGKHPRRSSRPAAPEPRAPTGTRHAT